MAREVCGRCGSGRVADGSLRNHDGLGVLFQTRKKAKWWHSAVSREVQARVCVDCGFIGLYADVSRLKVVKP
jgi:hypothetical protein